ncbi:hypothetical protein C9F09_17250, partial [Salmonella enterica subsp. enterica serovar Wilhelmsburg]
GPPAARQGEAGPGAAARQGTRLTVNGNTWMPLGKMIDEKVVVNGIVALLATGGSTNHTMHLVAMARAAGILELGRAVNLPVIHYSVEWWNT